MNEKRKKLEELSQRIREGEKEALALLIDRLKEKLVILAYRMVGDIDEAKDVVQDCFIKLWEMRRKIRKEGNILFLMRKMVVNLSLDILRKRKKEHKAREISLREKGLLFSPPEGERERFIKELSLIFSRLVSELPEKERAVFVLREIEGFSTEEIARMLNVAPSTVRNHLMHARARLRKEIELEYPEIVDSWKRL
jgi:RNA polymerase sigma-70 factor (ECF subfamily)